MSTDELLVVDLYPSLLQPEGDHGNVVALAFRARQYGLAATAVVAHPGDDVPEADIYFLGGSEDLDLPECARRLRASGVLSAAADRGAVVVGVGAGYSVLARRFTDLAGHEHEGVGLLDVTIRRDVLVSGPVVTRPCAELGLPVMSGYEFHVGRAERATGVPPLTTLEVGTGDGASGPAATGNCTDGARTGHVLGTWLHGPLLPRNPEFADLLLRWCRPDLLASRPQETGLKDSLAGAVRARRVAAARLNQ